MDVICRENDRVIVRPASATRVPHCVIACNRINLKAKTGLRSDRLKSTFISILIAQFLSKAPMKLIATFAYILYVLSLN